MKHRTCCIFTAVLISSAIVIVPMHRHQRSDEVPLLNEPRQRRTTTTRHPVVYGACTRRLIVSLHSAVDSAGNTCAPAAMSPLTGCCPPTETDACGAADCDKLRGGPLQLSDLSNRTMSHHCCSDLATCVRCCIHSVLNVTISSLQLFSACVDRCRHGAHSTVHEHRYAAWNVNCI